MKDLSLIPNSSSLTVDLHCHPSIKPFGRAHSQNINSPDPREKNSIWRYDPPKGIDRFINRYMTLTRFSQANFTALYLGNVRVASCAMNPVEKGLFRSRLGTGFFADLIYNIITGIGIRKINFIQAIDNYWAEFNREHEFYIQRDNFPVAINGRHLRYKLTRNYTDVEENLADPDVISVVLTIEGAYVFNETASVPPDESRVLANIDIVKHWPQVPFFISIMHHFFNHMGGHSKSFHGLVGKFCDQSFGLHTGITDLGRKVIRKLLDQNGGKRIHIDIKHMSCNMRKDYYKILDTEFRGKDIPVIVSHGALNGFESIYGDHTAEAEDNGHFYGGDVNFFDDEIVIITRSNGIFGLQLDDRLLSCKKLKRKARRFYYSRQKRLKLMAGIIWNHIQRVAETLDRNGLNAWGTIALGTDYDGIVDPPNGYWTSAELPLLYCNLCSFVREYLKAGNNNLQLAHNFQISADTIMKNLFSENARRFMERYYI